MNSKPTRCMCTLPKKMSTLGQMVIEIWAGGASSLALCVGGKVRFMHRGLVH